MNIVEPEIRRANPHSHNTDGPLDEDAYRRGFQQGADAAMKAIKSGATPRLIDRWWRAVYDWRFMHTHKKRIEPPRIIDGQIRID